MNDQDIRAVEGLARSGISYEDLCSVFTQFPKSEIRVIYDKVQTILTGNET